MKNKIAVLAVIAATMAPLSYAGMSVGVDYVKTNVEIDFYEKKAEPTARAFRFGYSFNDWISLEYRLGSGMSASGTGSNGGWLPADIEIDSYRGYYARLNFPVSDVFRPYVMVGKTKGDASISFSDGYKVSETESDSSSGMGVDFFMGQSSAIRVEKAKLIDVNGITVSSTSLGYTYRF